MTAENLIYALRRENKNSHEPVDGAEYRFVNEDGIEVCFQIGKVPRLLYMYGFLSPLPEEGVVAFYKKLLQAHFFGFSTGGASFALSDDLGQLMLCRVIEADHISEDEFFEAYKSFQKALKDWQSYLETEEGLVNKAGSSFASGGDRPALVVV